MNNHNTLSIDEAKFLKTSKKLQQQLNYELEVDLKLSKVQEMLAQSLGFRNLNSIQKAFTDLPAQQFKDSNLIFSIHNPDIFKTIDLDQSLQIIVNLMDKGNHDMWKGRAISLISSVMTALIYMRDLNEIILDVEYIREYLILDNLIKLYKNRRDFPDKIRASLRNYLLSLPGFQESAPKQNDTVMEQHGYLQVQFVSVINKLKKIEDNNFIIADQSWFTMEVRQKVISASGGTNRQTIENTEEYKFLTINPALMEFDFLEDSWLSMEEYAEWVVSLQKKEQLNNVRVSDLLIYVTTIISPMRSARMYLVLNSILDNYSIAGQVSSQICNRLKTM